MKADDGDKRFDLEELPPNLIDDLARPSGKGAADTNRWIADSLDWYRNNALPHPKWFDDLTVRQLRVGKEKERELRNEVKLLKALANNPTLSDNKLSRRLKIHRQTIMRWKRDPVFIDALAVLNEALDALDDFPSWLKPARDRRPWVLKRIGNDRLKKWLERSYRLSGLSVPNAVRIAASPVVMIPSSDRS